MSGPVSNTLVTRPSRPDRSLITLTLPTFLWAAHSSRPSGDRAMSEENGSASPVMRRTTLRDDTRTTSMVAERTWLT